MDLFFTITGGMLLWKNIERAMNHTSIETKSGKASLKMYFLNEVLLDE